MLGPSGHHGPWSPVPVKPPLAPGPLWGGWDFPSPWSSNYENILLTSLLSGEIALPLGDHLLLATHEKTLKGEFIDLFSLLYRGVEKMGKEELDDH